METYKLNSEQTAIDQQPELKYADFVDLNGRHDKEFKFKVRVTWDRYTDSEYTLFNIHDIAARSKWDAEQKAKDLFIEEISRGDKEQRKYLTAYVIDYLSAPMIQP